MTEDTIAATTSLHAKRRHVLQHLSPRTFRRLKFEHLDLCGTHPWSVFVKFAIEIVGGGTRMVSSNVAAKWEG